MSVSFGGIGCIAATFTNSATSAASAGKVVKLGAGGTVCACANGDRFMGYALTADAGAAAVQIRGYVTVGYSGTAPAVGYGRLVSDADGKVKADSGSTGGEYLITEVDSAAGTVGFFM